MKVYLKKPCWAQLLIQFLYHQYYSSFKLKKKFNCTSRNDKTLKTYFFNKRDFLNGLSWEFPALVI